MFIFNKNGVTICILVYIDDIIITDCTTQVIKKIIHALACQFSLKDLGPLNFFFGVKILSRLDGMVLTQTKYIHDIL